MTTLEMHPARLSRTALARRGDESAESPMAADLLAMLDHEAGSE